VAISDLAYESRGLELMILQTRAVSRDQIHELMLTDEQDAGPSKKVGRVFVAGFFEIKIGGIIRVGDVVSVGNRAIGHVAGFDETHMPNHQNIVVRIMGRTDKIVVQARKLHGRIVFRSSARNASIWRATRARSTFR